MATRKEVMADSQRLIKEPRFVQLNSGVDGSETKLAFPFLVFHHDEDDHLSGAVWCNDDRNNVGLVAGSWNARDNIGKGAPGDNNSWSEIGEGLED